jgi:hypothetical protein
MPTIITKGAMTAQGYGFAAQTAAPAANYIENVFSTYLYTGTGFAAGQSIANGIDLSTKGGLVWIKDRTSATIHYLNDTVNGAGNFLRSNQISSLSNDPTALTAFNTNGFTLGTDTTNSIVNTSPDNFVSWTFRKQAKFFDIVTYTGTGSNTTIAHNLGSVPGSIFVKRTDTTGNWQVYHSGLTSAAYSIQLNLTNAQASATTIWNSTAPTSSVFSVGTDATVNASGGTYVAYLFASNAGGFGSAGTDNVITCGSFTTDASNNKVSVNLGYEPQWVLVKAASGPSSTDFWYLFDSMRGMTVQTTGTGAARLFANATVAEVSNVDFVPTATGFTTDYYLTGASTTYIYIAIRRGPMKTPTVGTSVFSPVTRTGTGAAASITGLSFPPDLAFIDDTNGSFFSWFDKLRGVGQMLQVTPASGAEQNRPTEVTTFGENGISFGVSTNGWTNFSGEPYINYLLQRAPGFFDEVCYTGTGDGSTITLNVNHNLGVVPELMIVKSRSNAKPWTVYSSTTGTANYLQLNTTLASTSATDLWNGVPTSTLIKLGVDSNGWVNSSGLTYVAYLFATVAGVSKVGSFTGTGGTQTINCGFGAGGARWLMVKRTDSTGDWYLFDSARGFTSSSSPYLLMNSTAAQVTGNNGCYAASTGFTVTSTANATVNINGANYIFLSVA